MSVVPVHIPSPYNAFFTIGKGKFLRKNSVSEKIKAHFPQEPPSITTVVQSPPF